MHTRIRSISRGAAVGLSALALAGALAACGGDDTTAAPATTEAATTEAATTEAATTEAATTEAATTEAATTEAAPAGEVTEADLLAAEERYIEFINAAANDDAMTACGLTADPSGEPVTGPVQEACASAIQESGALDQITPEMVPLFTTDFLEAQALPDGKIELFAGGTSSGVKMVKASDGQWYISE